jgi:L-methionine (R)-S-oxide reductase
MAEDLIISSGSKEERYKTLIPQLRALLEGERDRIALLGNLCAALKYTMDFFWIGFYLVQDEELVLGPFQGPVACTRIAKGRGVCGTCWERGTEILVPDVALFPGHIACSSVSKSELVLPVFAEDGQFAGVLDADSDQLSAFDETDVKYLKEILALIKF